MTPNELREAANKIEKGDYGPDSASICRAFGWQVRHIPPGAPFWETPDGKVYTKTPMFIADMDSADPLWDTLFQRGWVLTVTLNGHKVRCTAINNDPWECDLCVSHAPTEARARTAIALRCRAEEMEAENSQ